MSRVSFFMLLAMAFAATTAHARSDLFGQLLSSKNSEECQKIPYLLCDRICDACVCDRRVPELAECTCAQWKSPELQKLEELQKKLVLVSKPVAKSVGAGFIPYPECVEKCDECVICTKVYPIEKAMCYCGKKTEAAEGRALPM